jgi:hypothetical protein
VRSVKAYLVGWLVGLLVGRIKFRLLRVG